jgi:hypothetical protein
MPFVIVAGGSFCGIGLLTMHLSNATSYLRDDPRACISCHVPQNNAASTQASNVGGNNDEL